MKLSALRATSRKIAALKKLKSQIKNQLHALKATEETPELIVEKTDELIEVLEQQVQLLQDSALELIQQHHELKESFILTASIIGYYEHLINDNGLKKIQAICAVMPKLLHAIHGMLNTKKEFNGERLYTLSVK